MADQPRGLVMVGVIGTRWWRRAMISYVGFSRKLYWPDEAEAKCAADNSQVSHIDP